MNKYQPCYEDYSRFKGWMNASFGYCKRHMAAYYRMEIEACVRASGGSKGNSLHLLEIGFGNGSFLGWARSQGHTVNGLELEISRLDAARKAGFTVAESLHSLLAQDGHKDFDGVVAFDVFEHMSYSQLKKLFRELHDVLKPGGWILARFPNGDSPFGRRNQHGDMTHVMTIGSMAVYDLAISSGLKLMSIGSQRLPVRNIGLPRAMVYLVSLILRILLEFPIQLLMNAYYPGEVRWFSLSPNLVTHLVKPAHEKAFSENM